MSRFPGDPDASTDEEQSDSHHPPYAWLGAAVLLWGMVAVWLVPMLGTWVFTVRHKPAYETVRVPGTDSSVPLRVPLTVRGIVSDATLNHGSGAVRESIPPFPAGKTLPSTCAIGEVFLARNGSAGQQIYGCVATNTWTLVVP
jgi:hypothetical protein